MTVIDLVDEGCIMFAVTHAPNTPAVAIEANMLVHDDAGNSLFYMVDRLLKKVNRDDFYLYKYDDEYQYLGADEFRQEDGTYETLFTFAKVTQKYVCSIRDYFQIDPIFKED